MERCIYCNARVNDEYHCDSDGVVHCVPCWNNMTLRIQVGEQIKTMRTARGVTQKKLATKIGTQQPHIVRIENGEENLTIETLEAIAKALKCKIEISFKSS